MKSWSLRKGLLFGSLAIMFLMALPSTGLAQGRGHGKNRGNQNWKCGKFVNCHDARDGRWDRGDRRRNISRNNDYWEQRNRYRNNYRYNRQRLQYPYSNAVRPRNYRNDRNGNRRYIVRNRRW